MSGYRFTPQAVRDLFEIWEYIARDNVAAADQVEAAVYDSCDLLASAPLAGHVRSDITELPLRFWIVQPYRSYVIVYDPAHHPLRVIRILHGARDVSGILSGES